MNSSSFEIHIEVKNRQKASLMDSITKQVLSMDEGPSLINIQDCVHLQEDWHLSFPELVL